MRFLLPLLAAFALANALAQLPSRSECVAEQPRLPTDASRLLARVYEHRKRLRIARRAGPSSIVDKNGNSCTTDAYNPTTQLCCDAGTIYDPTDEAQFGENNSCCGAPVSRRTR